MSLTTTKHAVEASPFGNGATGALAISSAVSNLNSLFTTAIGTAGSKTLTVGDSSGYATGDCIFIHYTHSSIANAASVGRWEFNYVASVDNATQLTLVYNLLYTYNYTVGSGDYDRSQCCKTNQYSTLTLNSGAAVTPTALFSTNRTTGGIIAVKATNFTLNSGATMSANTYGFEAREGGVHYNRASAGTGLSGIIDSEIHQATSYYGGGGGGKGDIGPSYGAGGAGGSLHSSYGNGGGGGGSGGGDNSTGNWDTLDPTFLQMGPAGGSGSSNYDPGQQDGKVGGNGGGLIVISAKNIDISSADTNALTSNGANGGNGINGGDCGGGGGSGGTIYLRGISIKLGASKIVCAGGTGGTAFGTNGRAGGDGGPGTVKIEMCRYSGATTAYLTWAYGYSFCGGLASIIA